MRSGCTRRASASCGTLTSSDDMTSCEADEFMVVDLFNVVKEVIFFFLGSNLLFDEKSKSPMTTTFTLHLLIVSRFSIALLV